GAAETNSTTGRDVEARLRVTRREEAARSSRVHPEPACCGDVSMLEAEQSAGDVHATTVHRSVNAD
ncbi:MAG TPA: hypothetical protein VFF73_01145, partial [Planctomycetota bacterium]|nr:hypothetical protein [Planctomycetota bacterium]